MNCFFPSDVYKMLYRAAKFLGESEKQINLDVTLPMLTMKYDVLVLDIQLTNWNTGIKTYIEI